MNADVHASPSSSAPSRPRRPRIAHHWQILVGLLLGGVVGATANVLATRPVIHGVVDPLDGDRNGVHDQLDWWALNLADPIGRVFIRLIFMVVIPLVVSALALGVVGMGDAKRLGRVGLKTLAYAGGFSLIAVAIGVFLVNTFQPGRMLAPEQQAALREQYQKGSEDAIAKARQAKPIKDTLLDIIPENPLQEMVGAVDASSKGNGMLAVMFFALVLGVAITHAPDRCRTLLGLLEGINEASMVIIGFAMRLAPLGVACLVFSTTARLGLALLPPLAGFVGTVLLGLGLQMLVVYPAALWSARFSPRRFFRGIAEAVLTAFGTSSSSATLPTSLRVAQDNLHLPRNVSNFVLTIGATGNQNGTALYEGVVVLFLAQVFQVDLTLAQQVIVVLMAVLAGIGTAGVPGGSLPLIVVVLQSVGVPGEGIAVILGIDRLLDMCRTVVNVSGDLTIAACVAGGETSGESTDP